MASVSTVPDARSERRGLTYWMERVLKELDKVRAAPDPDAVHDLRVALRRCRSIAAVLEEVDPDPAWREMRKLGRKVFRQLGGLRDVQVLEEWVRNLSQENDPIRLRLLAAFASHENELRSAALRVCEKFDHKSWKKLERHLRPRMHLVPLDRLAAQALALERLEVARELHAQAQRTERPAAWHELRIGVKRFRYTVEGLLPASYELWADDLKRLQDLLGDVHDLDVLSATIDDGAAQDAEEVRASWGERIASERHQRIETYRQLTLGKTSLWQSWRQALPQGNRLQAAAMARIRATAKALDGNVTRTVRISQIAMKLFDGLVRQQAAPQLSGKGVRKLLRAAGRLHAIGNALDPEAPQKAARRYLREMVVPQGWTREEWEMLVNVVRYHRGSVPDTKHKSFAALSEEQQRMVSLLAGILRLARALRKCGVNSAIGLRVDKSVEALILQLPGLEQSEEAAARLAAAKYLLESSLGRPLLLKAAPTTAKILELPQRQEPPQESAAASD
jgi:CHAD domain-containing protein